MGVPEERMVAEPGGRPRALQLLLIGLGIIVLLLIVWFLFLRGDAEEPDTALEPDPVIQETPEPEETRDAPRRERPVETFEVFAPKDPFDPLISAAAAGDGAAATGDGTAAGDAAAGDDAGAGDGTTTGDGTGTTTTTTTTTGGGNGGGGGEDVGGHRVQVIDVYRQGGNGRAQVQVDGTVYTVDEGERFAENFELLSTSGRCATMLYGDDEFTLCEGEEILK